MNLEILANVALALAALPCALFLVNLFLYRRLPRGRGRLADSQSPLVGRSEVSVLIPARNEEANIRATLDAVLANRGVNFEVIVLDDHSNDRTAEIVRECASRDVRVRLEQSPPLPDSWCGKQHACHVLAQHARSPLLVFMDADVRLTPDALERMLAFMQHKDVALASGVPCQELGTFGERLLIPQIHFILLGFLPMLFMRWTRRPAFSAGCGQLIVARRDAYLVTGGHSMIYTTLHDGLKLPRLFRLAGFGTDLFDATDVAKCRMYRTNAEVWSGLTKNATEGLAAPGTILPMTILLFGGQVLPFLLAALGPLLAASSLAAVIGACALAYLPRLLAVPRFRQPIRSAFWHPLGVLVLLVIQWNAFVRLCSGKPARWKGRSYSSKTVAQPAEAG